MAATVWRNLNAVACRVVGLVRRRPVLTVALWLLASLLPVAAADVAQLGGAAVVAVSWVLAGGRGRVRRVEAVSKHWARANNEKYRPGWFGWGIGASSRGGI